MHAELAHVFRLAIFKHLLNRPLSIADFRRQKSYRKTIDDTSKPVRRPLCGEFQDVLGFLWRHLIPHDLTRWNRAEFQRDQSPAANLRKPMRSVEVYCEQPTSMQKLLGNRRGRLRSVWKYWATVLLVPSRNVKLKSAAPALLNFLRTRGDLFSPACVVLIRMPEIKRCKRIRSRSGMPLRGLSNAGCPGLPRNSRQRSINGPDLYIVPVEISTLTRSWPIAGRTD